MPAPIEDVTALHKASKKFGSIEATKITHLIYETLLKASEKDGLSFEGVASFGKAVHDKIEWGEGIKKIEEAIKSPITVPLLRAVDVHFRPNFIYAVQEKLDEQEAESLSICLSSMDTMELEIMASLIYSVLTQAEFPFSDKDFGGMHPLSKFLVARYSWEDLKNAKDSNGKNPLVGTILVPLIESCERVFIGYFPTIFQPIAAEQASAQEEDITKEAQKEVEDEELQSAIDESAKDPEKLFGEIDPAYKKEPSNGKQKKKRPKQRESEKRDTKQSADPADKKDLGDKTDQKEASEKNDASPPETSKPSAKQEPTNA